MIEAKRTSSLSLPINSVKVQLSRLNKRISDQELQSPVVVKKFRSESFGSEAEGEHHLETPPSTPVPAPVLYGIDDDRKDQDEDRALEAANFFDLPTPDVMKAFPSGNQLKIKTEINPITTTSSSASTSSLNTPQITLNSSGQVTHPLTATSQMRGSVDSTYPELGHFMDDETEEEMNLPSMEGSLNTPNVDPSGNNANPFIFNNPFNQQPLLSHQSTRSSFSTLATHSVVSNPTQPLYIDVQEQQHQMGHSTSCEPSPSDQALEYAPPPYQQQEPSYTDLQVQPQSHQSQMHHQRQIMIHELPTTVAEQCPSYSPPMSGVPSPAPSNESSLASSSSPAGHQDHLSTDHFFGTSSSRGSLGRKGSDASTCSAKSRKTKKQQFTELVQRQQFLTQNNEELRQQLRNYEKACAKLKMMLLEKMKSAARIC